MAKRPPDQIGSTTRAKTRFADQVSEREASFRKRARLRHLPPEKLRASRFQAESRHSDSAVQDLAESIVELGLLQFPGARELEDGTLEILFGHRRVRAYGLAIFSGRLDSRKMPVYVARGVSDSEALRLLVAENFQRTAADADYIHEAELTGRIMQDLERELGRPPSIREMAAVMPCSRDTVHAHMQIFKALSDPSIGHLVRRSGDLPKGLMRRLLKHPHPDRQKEALDLAAAGRPTRLVRAALKGEEERSGPEEDQEVAPVVRRSENPGGGYTLQVNISPRMPSDQIDLAVAEVERTLDELRSMQEGKGSGT